MYEHVTRSLRNEATETTLQYYLQPYVRHILLLTMFVHPVKRRTLNKIFRP